MLKGVKGTCSFNESIQQLIGGDGEEERIVSIYDVINKDDLKELQDYFILLSNEIDSFVNWKGDIFISGNDKFPFSRLINHNCDASRIFSSIFDSIAKRYEDVLPQVSSKERERFFLVFIEALHIIGAHFMNASNQQADSRLLTRLAYYDERLDLPNSNMLQKDIRKANPQTTVLIGFKLHKKTNSPRYVRIWRYELPKAVRDWVSRQPYSMLNLYLAGENYFVLLLKKTDLEQSREVAKQLLTRFESPWQVEDRKGDRMVKCGCNVGIMPMTIAYYYKSQVLNLMEYTVDYAASQVGMAELDEDLLDKLLRM